MAKKRIISLLTILALTTPLIQVKEIYIPSEPRKEVESDKNLNLRSYKLEQVEEIMRVEFEKRKEIERQRAEEERIRQEELRRQEEERQRLLEEQKQPHFNPYDVTELSNLNKEEIYEMLKDTSLITLVDALYWYEQEYNVNLIFITSIVALESGWGRSSLAITHNNLTGYIGRNGDYYAFNNWGESLQETFRLIGEEYVSEDGLFYNGKSVWNINQKYCELDSWSGKVINIGNELLSKIN